MPRKPRIELPGGLYHVISRGNNPKKPFRCANDYLTFTEIVASQKSNPPFYLYAYCLRIEELLNLTQRMSGLSRKELFSNSRRTGTIALIGFYPVADASQTAADLGQKTLIALGP